MKKAHRLYRSRENRMIAGICGGMAEYWDMDPTIVRLIFVLVSLLPGPSIIFYLIAWVVIPLEPRKNG